jgi:chromosome segregation ATPase
MATSKNNTSPTKVVSLRLPIEEYEKYASEASDLGLDLSPHLMEKLKWYDELQIEKENLENNYFDIRREREKLNEEQVKLKNRIQSLSETMTALRNANESYKTMTDKQLQIEKQKSLKSQQEYTQLLAKKDELLTAKEKEIADLKQEQIATKEKMEETVDKIIDKAHDYYWDAPVVFKKKWTVFEKPLKKIYNEAFPKPENKPKPLFSLSSGIANRVIEEIKKTHNF